MSIIVTFGCLIITIILMNLMYKIKHRRYYQLLEQFPSYPRYPLIGNVHLIMGRLNDLFVAAQDICLQFDRFVFWLGPMPLLALRKHEDIMTILNQTQERECCNLLDEWAGIGILTARYNEWKTSRKLLNPAFTTAMLSKYVDVFNKQASNLAENLKSVVDTGEEIDVLDHLFNTNLETIVENIMGVSMESNKKLGKEFCCAALKACTSITKRVLSPWLHPHQIYELYLKITGENESIKQAQNFSSKIMKDQLKNMDNQNIQLRDVDSSKTIIDSIVYRSIKELGLSEKRTTDEFIQIIFAGMETTALNLSFLMLMLAIHQDVQQKVYEEIIETTGGDHTITVDQAFHQLKYLEQCIRETMRMYSPVTVTTRRTHKECVLGGNVIVPAKTVVAALIFLSNRDPELFKNPDKWDPEHYSEQAIAERPKGVSQLTFGYGPRSCLGAKYAMISIKTQISRILLSYNLSTHVKELTKNDLKLDLMVRSKIGFPIKFNSR